MKSTENKSGGEIKLTVTDKIYFSHWSIDGKDKHIICRAIVNRISNCMIFSSFSWHSKLSGEGERWEDNPFYKPRWQK